MNVNELLDTIEDTLAESANMPLSGGKRIVDVDQIQEYLDEIRANLPGELRQAQAIVNDRGQIVDSANAQAKAIIRQAEEKEIVIISTALDTFTAAQHINQSIPVKYFMTNENLVTFNMKDFVDDVKEVLASKRFGDFPIVHSKGK